MFLEFKVVWGGYSMPTNTFVKCVFVKSVTKTLTIK